jgi:hypothetical protein
LSFSACGRVCFILHTTVLSSDPEAEVPFAQALYGDDKFMRAFFNSLSDDGILIMQLGEAPTYGAPDETYSKFKNRASTTTLLATLGFQSIHMYGEVSVVDLLILFAMYLPFLLSAICDFM